MAGWWNRHQSRLETTSQIPNSSRHIFPAPRLEGAQRPLAQVGIHEDGAIAKFSQRHGKIRSSGRLNLHAAGAGNQNDLGG